MAKKKKLRKGVIFALVILLSFVVNPLAQLVMGAKYVDWTQSLIVAVILSVMAAALIFFGKT